VYSPIYTLLALSEVISIQPIYTSEPYAFTRHRTTIRRPRAVAAEPYKRHMTGVPDSVLSVFGIGTTTTAAGTAAGTDAGGHDEGDSEAPTEGYNLDARADEIEGRIEAVASLTEAQRDDIGGMVESLGELSAVDETAVGE